MEKIKSPQKINVVGLGPGGEEFLTLSGREAVESCTLLIGDRRQIASVKNLISTQKIHYLGKLSELPQFLESVRFSEEVTVLVSGDTGFYSLLDFLRKNLGEVGLNVIPGISSFQYLFSRLKKCWHDYLLLSLHGRECNYAEFLPLSRKGIILLTDSVNTPVEIGRTLTEKGLGDIKIIVGENLSYTDERIISFHARDYRDHGNFSMNIVILEKE